MAHDLKTCTINRDTTYSGPHPHIYMYTDQQLLTRPGRFGTKLHDAMGWLSVPIIVFAQLLFLLPTKLLLLLLLTVSFSSLTCTGERLVCQHLIRTFRHLSFFVMIKSRPDAENISAY